MTNKTAANLRTPAAYMFAVCVGAAATTQAAINARLGTKLDSAMMSSLFTFTIASFLLACLCMGMLYHRSKRIAIIGLVDRPTVLELSGGVWGAIFVVSANFLTPELGFAMFFVLLVAGQLFASLLLDAFGWFGAKKEPTTKLKLAAIALTYTGAALSVIERLINTFDGSDESVSPALVAPFALFAFIGGACLPFQGAINGKLSKKLPSRLHATFVSFLVGTVGCCIGLAISLLIDSAPLKSFSDNAATTAWWNWMGGPFGILVVVAAIVGPMLIGFANYFVCVIAGQLVLSLLFDHFGMLGFAENKATALRIVGVCIVLVGVVFLQYVKKRQARISPTRNAGYAVSDVDEYKDSGEGVEEGKVGEKRTSGAGWQAWEVTSDVRSGKGPRLSDIQQIDIQPDEEVTPRWARVGKPDQTPSSEALKAAGGGSARSSGAEQSNPICV